VKRYVVEEGSVHARRLLRRYRVISSAVFHVELGSTLRRRKTEGALSGGALKRVLDRVRSDAASWSLVAVADLPFVTADARQAAAARAVGRDVINAVADRPISRGP
jgi:hypothetical protein